MIVVVLANTTEPPFCVSAVAELLTNPGMFAGVCKNPELCVSCLVELLVISCMLLDPAVVVVLANTI